VGADLSILVHNFFTRFRRGIDRAMGYPLAALFGHERDPPALSLIYPSSKAYRSTAFVLDGWMFYCKIYLFNPHMRSRLPKILPNGGVLSRVFQPHEVHI